MGTDVVRALKELRIVGGPGQRVTRGPNGTTIASVTRKGSVTTSTDNLHPFRLAIREAVTGSGSSATVTHYAVVMCNYGAVQMDDYVAFCDNTAATGMENGWKDIAFDFSGSGGAQVSRALEDIYDDDDLTDPGDVLVFVFHKDNDGTDEIHYRVQFDNAWDEAIDEDDRIGVYYVGTMRCDCDDPWKFSVQNQVMKSALVVGEKEDELFPFKLKRVNRGTEEDPEWVKLVYIPVNAISVSEMGVAYSKLTEDDEEDDWYVVPTSAVDIALRFCVEYNTDYAQNPSRVYYDVGAIGSSFDPSEVDTTKVYKESIFIGRIDANGNITQSLRSSVSIGGAYSGAIKRMPKIDGTVIRELSAGANVTLTESPTGCFTIAATGGGGGGSTGTQVTVTESQDAATGEFLTWESGTGPTGSISLKRHAGIDASCVAILDGGDEEVWLDDYLGGSTTGPSDLGMNINTENFADECLAQTIQPTGEEEGTPWLGTGTRASRDDHHHLIDDLVNSENTPLGDATGDGENSGHAIVEDWLKRCGIIFGGGGSQPTGETGENIPDDDMIVTFGDITEGVTGTIGATGIGSDNVSATGNIPANNLYFEDELEDEGIWQGEWERDTDTEGKGCKFQVCCGARIISGSKFDIYRELTFDKYGMLRKVSRAKNGIWDYTV